MRKLIPAFLIAAFLLLLLALWVVPPSSAQEPTPPPKGSQLPPPLPPTEPAPSNLKIDPHLLTKIEPPLLKKLLESGSPPIAFIVYLKESVDLAAAVATVPANNRGAVEPLAKRTAIVNTLQQTAGASQADVLQVLNSPTTNSAGQISAAASDIRPLWIVNAVAAKGTLDMVLALAARPDVAVVRLDKKIEIGDWRFVSDKFQSTAGGQNAISNLQSPFEWGVSKIRADLVHTALGLTGAGVVVANIDTGVDWQHPALQSRYRGYTGPGKLPQHLGNWFDATTNPATYPIDGNGHGTHTMGVMAGTNGIGVAPGARWIAARAFDSSGIAQSSWLHSAFQWVLAPNGNPALAPNIVNNSWSNQFGISSEFQPDIQALLTAGIFPVFSAGNNGPDVGTVGSPASLDIAFAIGATDINDEIALFSSRGPSPWNKIKPEVTAPGKTVLSSLPGGAYGELSGTSMAAPHVAGVVALMLQASPALANNLSQISTVLTSTAVHLGNPTPNSNYGWGRVDAYNAVMAVGSFGTLQGAVTQAGNNLPVANASLQIAPHSGGPLIQATTTPDGSYLQGLSPNTYDMTVAAFGFLPATQTGLSVTNGSATTQNFSLTPQPVGTLTGVIRESGSGLPLAATLSIAGTPAQAISAANGSYTLSLPEGVYTATVVAAAHRITQAVNLTINAGAALTQDFWLDTAPKILLVDSGRWYQESQVGYYHQALTDLRYPYDLWSITKPYLTPNDVPVTSTLTAYDIVIWSAPRDAPGYVGADAALRGFLKAGGKLILSGQDVAYFDGGGSILGSAAYFRNELKATFVQEQSDVFTVTGVSPGPLADLSLTLNGGDGANNQASPDVIANADPDFAKSLLNYGGNDGLAGLNVGLCVPYRAVLLPFGFEAINNRTDRTQLLGRALDWLLQGSDPAGLEVTPLQITKIGNFGSVVSHTLRVRNTGANPDTFNLSVTPGVPYGWPLVALPPAAISLPSCQSQTITISTRINVASRWHISDTYTVAVQSTNQPALSQSVTRTVKTPAPLLLVDDDRWISFAANYTQTLETLQIPYDYWQVPKSWSGPLPPSPSTETLQMYPMTLWYMANDWYQPLTTEEEDRLAAYLQNGGRLTLSGQDYLYALPNHQPSTFAQTYLGILSHSEDYSSTSVTGRPGNPVGNGLGPFPLTFPNGYANFTDGLTPTATAQIATIGQAGQANSLTQAGSGSGGSSWHTHFLSFGPELLAPTERARLLQRSLGWLSWLGRSTVTPSVAASLDGTDIIYTATLLNDGWIDLPAAVFTATFPAQLTPGSASPGLNLVNGQLVWSGPLARNQAKVLTYTASIAAALPLGTKVSQTSWLYYPEHHLLFDRVAETRVNFPELGTSALTVSPSQGVEPGTVLNYSLTLRNSGLVNDPVVTATGALPPLLDLLGLDPPGQGTLLTSDQSFTWTTALASNQEATLTYRAVISYRTGSAVAHTVQVNDGLNEPLLLTARSTFKVLPLYFPILFKK
ncbi:MAG: S8 family serine peptidase [Anaerolineae bacterium]